MTTITPPRIKQQLTIDLPKDHWIEIEDFACENGMNVAFAASSMIEAVIEEWIARSQMMEAMENETT